MIREVSSIVDTSSGRADRLRCWIGPNNEAIVLLTLRCRWRLVATFLPLTHTRLINILSPTSHIIILAAKFSVLIGR